MNKIDEAYKQDDDDDMLFFNDLMQYVNWCDEQMIHPIKRRLYVARWRYAFVLR